MKSFVITLFTTVLLIFSTSAHSFSAEEKGPHIADILITTSQSHLLLFCTIKNSFTPEMIEGVQNGIPVTFTFHIELEQVNNKWFDKTITEMELNHTLTFDSLKEEYLIQQSEKPTTQIKTDDLVKAMEVMSELNGIKIIPRDKLIPDEPYAIHVQAKLAEKTLPLHLHNIIPFISLWDFETDLRTIEFHY